MFNFIRDREQEITLLKFAKLEAEFNKHNIQEARGLDPIYKKDGSLHKTKNKERQVIVNRWIKEQKNLKKFFIAHQKEGNNSDYNRYNYRRGISDTRTWIEDRFKSRSE